MPIWIGLLVGVVGLVVAVRAVIDDTSAGTPAGTLGADVPEHPAVERPDGRQVPAAEPAVPMSVAVKTTTVTSVAAVAAIVLAGLAVFPAGVAKADPPPGSSADAVVKALQDQGYNVQFNMPSNMQLSRCTVSGVRGLTVMMGPNGNLMMAMAPNSANTTVYVDLACPDSNN